MLLQTILSSNCKVYSKNDALALAIHCYFYMKGFKSLESKDDDGLHLKDNWNIADLETNRKAESFEFVYRHSLSASRFYVKVVPISKKLIINAVAEDKGQVFSLDISPEDFLTQTIQSETQGAELSKIYHNLGSLAGLLRLHLYNNLLPPSPTRNNDENTQRNRTPDAGPNPEVDRPRPGPRGNPPPIHDPLMIGGPFLPRRPQFVTGDDDLYPGGLGGGGFGGGGFGGGFGGGYGGGFGGGFGGMHVGPNHPDFGRNMVPDPGRGPGPFGPAPPPPRARFDPYGPPGVPGNPNPDFDGPPPDWMFM